MEILILILFPIYFLPCIVASFRKHRQQLAIFMVNLLLGWTFLGWVVALVWACTADVQIPKKLNDGSVSDGPDEGRPLTSDTRQRVHEIDDDWALKADETLHRYVQEATQRSRTAEAARPTSPAEFGKRHSGI
jgi:hypothetical protein